MKWTQKKKLLKTSRVYCSKRWDHNGSFQSQHILHGCTHKFTSNSYFLLSTPCKASNITHFLYVETTGWMVCLYLNPNPLVILAKNLPESAKIQHHVVTLPPNCWTWLELGHPAHVKYPCRGTVLTESIKIQQTNLVWRCLGVILLLSWLLSLFYLVYKLYCPSRTPFPFVCKFLNTSFKHSQMSMLEALYTFPCMFCFENGQQICDWRSMLYLILSKRYKII